MKTKIKYAVINTLNNTLNIIPQITAKKEDTNHEITTL